MALQTAYIASGDRSLHDPQPTAHGPPAARIGGRELYVELPSLSPAGYDTSMPGVDSSAPVPYR